MVKRWSLPWISSARRLPHTGRAVNRIQYKSKCPALNQQHNAHALARRRGVTQHVARTSICCSSSFVPRVRFLGKAICVVSVFCRSSASDWVSREDLHRKSQT